MRFVFALAALLGALLSAPAMAGDKEIAAIQAVLGPGDVDPGLFATEFLQQVPPAQLAAVLKPIKAQIGPVESVRQDAASSYTVETADFDMPVDIVLNGEGKISGLLLRPPTARNASLDDLVAGLKGLAPQVGFLVTKNGAPLASSDPDKPLAVGSAFKLGILKALKDEIASGAHKWTDIVTLEKGDISLPSGMLQSWPVGSPLTIHTLAAMMISISDNTATDTLLRVVGRGKVEAALGVAPVLTTRELFTLKGDSALQEKYLKADEAGKRDLLKQIDQQDLPDVTKIAGPFVAGIEYDVSPNTLCQLIDSVADVDVFSINPGVARPTDWQSIAFKGGSEPGVLNLTTRVVAKDGTAYCVSATWNGPTEIDATKAQSAYASVLARLAKGA